MIARMLTLLLLLSPVAFSCDHLPLGKPAENDFYKCRSGYAVGYSYSLKSAVWVSYVLDAGEQQGVDRTNDFRSDLDIPLQYRTYPSDYEEPIYAQGHLANAESIDGSYQAMSETFLMSNMTPQLPSHNGAIWKGLENRERKWAKVRGRVLVSAGPLYEGIIEKIGSSGVPVPSHYWKVIYDIAQGETIAFIVSHRPLKTAELDRFLVSVDEVEDRANIDLMANLPIYFQQRIESMVQPKQW